MLGPVKSWQNENNEEIGRFPIAPEKLASVIKLVEDGKLSFRLHQQDFLTNYSKILRRTGQDC